jgi:hypothetical protein
VRTVKSFALICCGAVLLTVGTVTVADTEERPTPTPTPTPVLTLGRSALSGTSRTPLPTPIAASGIVITDSNLSSFAAQGKINVSGGDAPPAAEPAGAPTGATPATTPNLPGLEEEAAAIERAEARLAQLRQRDIEHHSEETRRAVAAAEKQVADLRQRHDERRALHQSEFAVATEVSMQSQWQERYTTQLEEVESLRTRVARLEARLAELRQSAASAGEASQRSQIGAVQQTLTLLRAELDRAEDELNRIRASAP